MTELQVLKGFMLTIAPVFVTSQEPVVNHHVMLTSLCKFVLTAGWSVEQSQTSRSPLVRVREMFEYFVFTNLSITSFKQDKKRDLDEISAHCLGLSLSTDQVV